MHACINLPWAMDMKRLFFEVKMLFLGEDLYG